MDPGKQRERVRARNGNGKNGRESHEHSLAIETPTELVAAIEAEIQGIPAPLSKQVRALSELFRLFTAERSSLGRTTYLDSPKLRSAYLRYHLPLNVARATRVLSEVLRVHPAARDLTRVFD